MIQPSKLSNLISVQVVC